MMGRRAFESEKARVIDIHTGKPADETPLPTVCERVRHYRTLRKMEQKELARQLNITPNSVSNWECGRSRPDVSLLPELCRVLEITPFELMGMHNPAVYSEHERLHMDKYRKLAGRDRYLVANMRDSMLVMREAENSPKLIRLPYFEKPLAAGIGDPTEFEGLSEEIYLYETDEYRRADYVFRVNGDSMEPDYRSGDLVLVERVPSGLTLQEGEIGAFIVGNEMYIKEYRADGLHSLNKKYDVLKFDADQAVYLIGKVLTVLDPESIASQSDVERFLLLHE